MQSKGQSSQLEEPTATVLEDAVVAWHAELQLLPCEHHHHYHQHHLAPVLQHPYHLQGKESKALKEKYCLLELPERSVFAFTYPFEARLDLDDGHNIWSEI